MSLYIEASLFFIVADTVLFLFSPKKRVFSKSKRLQNLQSEMSTFIEVTKCFFFSPPTKTYLYASNKTKKTNDNDQRCKKYSPSSIAHLRTKRKLDVHMSYV